MCGIVGVLGSHEVSPIILEALKRLEYRGYDSAGIATLEQGHLDRRRAVGKLINLSDTLVRHPLPGKSGIGHTRWATHGGPNEVNAHPHRAGPVAVVHNGIIENFAELRAELAGDGYLPDSETDTEIVALLVRRELETGAAPQQAVERTLARLTGAFALGFLFDGHPDLMIAARRGSPLAIGHGSGEMYLGSDAIALAPMTDRITYLEEGDLAVLTRAGARIFDAGGRPVERPERKIRHDATRMEKDGHRHWMAKEIAEQPAVFAAALAHYLPGGALTFAEGKVDFSRLSRVIMVACGTAHLACLTAKYWLERLSGLPVEVDIASEFRYRAPPIGPDTLAIFVSQSGETADTLAALRHCAGRARSLAVVNVPESSLAREADLALPILAGTEIGVASTKAFTCQLGVLALLAIKAGRDRGGLDAEAVEAHLDALSRLPALMSQALAAEPEIEAIARRIAEARDVLFLGRGAMYPLALEGALKLKEISYIHAEGYASGELKHGPIALIDEHVPVIVMAPHDALFDKTVSNMQEVMARGGKVILVTDAAGAAAASAGTAAVALMPQVGSIFAPVVYAVPAQLLAYHAAIAKGTDVDQPRNLAKSVTVE